ncbi:RabGAP/TBC [Melanomma pulvis-pyrius CBS 109.77]|uniref:RabGAP/TBC n=1 Tax=Melanomma pulvis-pyrius CBS 109.77 TaxID=1314802 RepID=A0A6A6X0D8_9PLEO|nr:RabGAP/TBC [Melanomma pulvis-pyrius CBS 109.77]
MRTVSEAEKHWHQLDDFHSLTDLKISVSAHNEPQITAGLRSVCWKIFLLFKTLDRSSWPNRLNDSRTTYNSLRSHYLRAIQHPDEFESSEDPLSENEESPWVALRADETLRAEIFQDIERCMPDNMYFRQPATQNMMLDVLFVWCKMHPDIGYRQGMHEVLAPILWVVERDAVDTDGMEHREIDHTLADVLDSRFIEHDTSTLFSLIMRTAKSFYAPADLGSVTKETPMLIRSARIFERYLPKADPDLAAHLVKLEIVPQIFLLRWIRLLFGREFPLDSVLNMWDALFAIDPSLELVDMISIAMLLRIRWQLVASDTNEAFSLLLRYPEPDAPAYTFIKDALYLRDHLTPEGGAEIITRYGMKAPVIEPKPFPNIRVPSPSPSFSSSRTRQTATSPRSVVQQGVGFEALLQGAAKGVLERGSQWGVGKVIRDAVGEVRKNVEAYQSGPVSIPSTPRSGGREYRKPGQIATAAANGRPGLERTMSGNIVKKMEGLERRNKGLAKMLDSAVGELWDYHKERAEDGKDNKDAIEALSLAIAKVQFVQVYLEDSSIPLPADDHTVEPATGPGTPNPLTPTATSPPIPERTSSAPPIANTLSAPPSSTSSSATPNPFDTNKSAQLLSPLGRPTSATPASPSASNSLSPRSRPLLTSSSFSWMLGQESAPSTFVSGTAHTSFPSDEKRRMRGSIGGRGFLFGDEEDAAGAVKDGKAKGKGGKTGGKGGKSEVEVEEEIIDLEDVGKRGVC